MERRFSPSSILAPLAGRQVHKLAKFCTNGERRNQEFETTDEQGRHSRNQNDGPLCSLECGSLLPLLFAWSCSGSVKASRKAGVHSRQDVPSLLEKSLPGYKAFSA
jgi:hypothetical protein